jgi:hypothetical protein
MASATPVTVTQLHAVIVMPAVKCCLKGLDADTLWFLGIPVRLLDLPDHARVHTLICPFC